MTRTLSGPPDWPVHAYIGKLSHSAMRVSNEGARQLRRKWCKHSPILFALTYLPHHLTRRGSGEISLSEFHVELAASAKRWANPDLGPKEVRDGWIAPRYSGKTTWLFCILTLWAMAYGHRRFICVYSDTASQARIHLATLRIELTGNERLIRDFPELCAPALLNGRPLMNNQDGYAAANGTVVMVRGMDSATLGVKLRERRPDALFFDEMEPKEGRYNIEIKEKRLQGLIETVLPIDPCAVVQIAGTTVMKGSIIDDMIQGVDWVAKQRIVVHHFLPTVTDLVTGVERSIWPQMWPLSFLRAEQAADRAAYAKNYLNQPVSVEGTFWDEDDFTYRDLTQWAEDRILVIDPAAKSKKSNDETAIGLLSYAGNLRKVMVERVQGYRIKPESLRDVVHKLIERYNIRTILVDVGNGGDHVLNSLRPLPLGVKVIEVPAKKMRRGKADRFADLLRLYQRGRVVHRDVLTGVETQMRAYPKNTLHDDMIDVVCMGVEYFLWDDPEFAAIRQRVSGS